MGQVRKLVRQHTQHLVSIPPGLLALLRAPEHQGKVELVLRMVPNVPDYVELEVRWLNPTSTEVSRAPR